MPNVSLCRLDHACIRAAPAVCGVLLTGQDFTDFVNQLAKSMLLPEAILAEVGRGVRRLWPPAFRRILNSKVTVSFVCEGTARWACMLSNCVSQACRSAIMFGQDLSDEECHTLIQSLAKCAFPFQCAHGRPSVAPLVSGVALPKPDVPSTRWWLKEIKLQG